MRPYPIADAGGPFEVDEGSTIELLNDTWEPNGDQLEFLWTVTPATGVVEILDPTAAVPTLRGIDDGTATIDVVVSDVDGVSSASTSVTVDNVAPTVDAGPDVTLPEGALLDVAASFTDPGRLDTHEATVHWGDTTGADPVTVTDGTVPLAHVYADDGEYTVVVCVVDKDGGEGCDSLVVTVTNADPSVVVGTIGDGPEFFLPFVAVPVAASFNDPGTLDTHVARFAWGDGTESDGVVTEEPFGPPGSVDGLDGTVTGVHTYTAPGLYTLALTVTDKDGGVGQATAQVEVLSPAEAVARVLEQLEALAVDPAVDAQAVAALQEVLKHLGGPTDPSRSGAFHRLEDEDWAAAVRKLEQALHELARAAAADPALDLHLAQLVLTQVAESVATDIYGRAVAALDPPSRGEARQLERISSTIDAGRAARADGRWVDAAALFHDAVRRAMDLL